ncbi:extracellular solute-binding protein [Planosporangium flavigriseum]|uniref:Sugar ABC transporter substrate-binding protein n=1 Tax=Planosporangium flavigriseum TaxID=373681 RepID=A0A8J3LLE2_9ACTN|nr:extracellular solute-binding protein [Planosporangium flavigriseum]NJC66596.1 extracellular solute-binding protein [Planosporangium flavigriseum]GIG73469.1 sugar ABC transporter substrate-binding protein [Planosporangium flavigriseum]
MVGVKRLAAAATAVGAVVILAACGSGGSGGGNAGGPVTLTWWHNGTNEPLKTLWQQVADAYHQAHPNVKISVVPIQNEQFTTKIPLALQSNNPPDIYFNQGGGLLATHTESGRVAHLTDLTAGFVKDLGPAAAGWQVDGKQYGIPYDTHVVGFWYRKDLFGKAGITTPPSTMDELNADIVKLKAANITPIALGGKDRWPDAFYYNYFAVRECSVDTLKSSVKARKFNDPCFTKAGQDVLDFLASKPFQPGFNGTPAQQGAGSSAGLVANGAAAMELQGDWEPSVMVDLATDKNFTANLGWFPFPSISGGKGDPNAALGGGDGFSCTTKNAAACADFLTYLAGPEVQTKLVKAGAAVIPVNAAAASTITDPTVKQVFDYSHQASYVQTYFDIALPTNQGQALDDAVANMFAGQGGADAVAKAVNGAS